MMSLKINKILNILKNKKIVHKSVCVNTPRTKWGDEEKMSTY